jgi:benzoyl-CoA reductase/2-hydroxyglutaryl-CoA dehydratase subunit BcrC/BadD/HgdB
MAVQELLNKFHDIAANPGKQMEAYLKAGKRVVLCAPVYTPEEIVHAMGAVPMGAWGADTELQLSKKYFPAFICSIMQSILELGIKGTYDGASAIIIPSLCDSLKCLGENWKYAVPDITFIPMVHPQNRAGEAGRAFTKAGYQRVIKTLEKLFATTYDDAALWGSIRIYNEHNAVMREVSALLAEHPEISACARSDIFKSAMFMLKEEHTALVKDLIEALKRSPAGETKVKVLISGIIADSHSLNSIFDDLGIQIVADDVAAQSRQYRTGAPEAETALDSLVLKFSGMGNCSLLFDVDKKRADLIVKTAQETGARGVIVILTKFCDPEEFDYVIIKSRCEEAGLPVTLVEVDRQMVNYEQARTIIETFKDMI